MAQKDWRGMHQGTVAGKWFEKTRRNRKKTRNSEVVVKNRGKK